MLQVWYWFPSWSFKTPKFSKKNAKTSQKTCFGKALFYLRISIQPNLRCTIKIWLFIWWRFFLFDLKSSFSLIFSFGTLFVIGVFWTSEKPETVRSFSYLRISFQPNLRCTLKLWLFIQIRIFLFDFQRSFSLIFSFRTLFGLFWMNFFNIISTFARKSTFSLFLLDVF